MTGSPDRDGMQWIERLEDWNGSLPVILVLSSISPIGRRAALKDLVAAVLGSDPGLIETSHHSDRAPLLVCPADTGLFLSSGSRGANAALAMARSPIGVARQSMVSIS